MGIGTYYSLRNQGLTPEQCIAAFLLGEGGPSPLKTDGYKFSMAQAGFPLREEVFILSLRKGGPYYIPFDINAIIQALIPGPCSSKEQGFLQAHGYQMNSAMEAALKGKVHVVAAPKGSWVLGGEPLATVRGPSFLASWLEPLGIMLNYPIQIATAYTQKGVEGFPVCPDGERGLPTVCEDERGILAALAECLGAYPFSVYISDKTYREGVYQNAMEMVLAVNGDAERIFEVGLRGATCMEQHMIALSEIRKTGINKTSNVWGAWQLYMIPVGTTGHEHQERWGSDENGFLAISDMRPEPPSFLFDTYDPVRCGIPTALKLLRQNPNRPVSLRFDSGDQDAQFLQIRRGCSRYTESILFEKGLLQEGDLPPLVMIPNLIFEDSYNPQKTVQNEAFCDKWGWPREKRMYGPGGWLISKPHPTPFGRDLSSAAYKLCWSNGARKKFSGTKGKGSVAGRPCILRGFFEEKCLSLIAQEGEKVAGYFPLEQVIVGGIPTATELSPQTQRLARMLEEKKDAQIAEIEGYWLCERKQA